MIKICDRFFGLVLSFSLVLFASATTCGLAPAYAKKPVTANASAKAAPKDGSAKADTPASETAPAAEEYNEGVTDEEAARAYNSATIRVNNLANLEALLNIIANGIEILCIAIGAPTLIAVPVGIFLLFKPKMRIYGIICIVSPIVIIVVGLAAPGIINWIVASMRDSGAFK